MNKISIHEILDLRKKTGLGIMTCKKALIEVNGDINKAINFLIKDGQKINTLNSKLENKNNNGIVIAKTNPNNTIGVVIILTCQTDFVSKNEKFISLAKEILDISLLCHDKYSLLNYKIDKYYIKDKIIYYMNIFKEKIELKLFEKINSPFVSCYVHNGNKIASLVGFKRYYNGIENIGKNISMQVVATNPKYIDENDLFSYKEIYKNNFLDQEKLEKILLYQSYIKNTKISVKEYIENLNKNIKISIFKRINI